MMTETLNSERAAMRYFRPTLEVLLPLLLLLGGCANSANTYAMDFDPAFFKTEVDETLKVGMAFRDAMKAVHARFPKPSSESVMPPMLRSGGVLSKRYIVGWPTTTPGKNLTLCLFVDTDGNLEKWTAQ